MANVMRLSGALFFPSPLKLGWLHERHMRIEDEYGRLKRPKV